MLEEENANDSLPSKLRVHIKEERLRPDPALFQRSVARITGSVLLPYLLIAVVVLLARTELVSPVVLVLLSLPLFLAAQRCFQTLVHDLSHKLFSTNTRVNDLLGDYLVAGWTGASIPAYRAIHLQHHRYNGSAPDPEHISFAVVQQRGGLFKHCLRYIVGLEILRLVKKYYGRKESPTPAVNRPRTERGKSSLQHVLICQLLLFAVFLFLANAWYLYLIWLYLAVTWNPLLSNMRFLVEHPGETDLTISTPSNWLERLYFAPFNFNFHLEHHLWPSVPPYRLGMAHSYLRQQGYFDRHPEFLGTGFVHSLTQRDEQED